MLCFQQVAACTPAYLAPLTACFVRGNGSVGSTQSLSWEYDRTATLGAEVTLGGKKRQKKKLQEEQKQGPENSAGGMKVVPLVFPGNVDTLLVVRFSPSSYSSLMDSR